ncbi:efflux RND transporter periplasmic adaptor subunit [Desulfovibrio sp.]|uniref:efflux RND transporter periplasmic adaptor subunit n=1 Tax=Desulfovibrio sp. TaxID=885 RepID=UPI0025BB3963|nr:efflux RND transporter periplasmic adaptor subunit [Desulfovibrio sp.]MCI7569930.1 efflux RND transporter periplasmic adaptor subunit [Desulfovibrio sp.]
MFTVLILASCLSLTACLGFGDDDKKQQGTPALPVGIFTVRAQDTPWPAEFQAQASGSRSVEVRARVQGIIEKRLYEEGSFVKAGQQLFQIERDQYEALVQQAEAQLDSATREWKRVRPLYEKNAVSQKERDNARAAYDSARAALREARINLDYCQVVAPVSGYSSKENYTVGNLVSPNSLLTYVNQTDPMNIDFSIAAPNHMRRRQLELAGRLRRPENNIYSARLRLLDGSMYDGTGEVNFIDSQVQADTGVIKARASFANSKNEIMPGQYVRIYMDGDVLTDAILIPQSAVMITQKGTFVMVVDSKNIVSPRAVKISDSIGESYLVDEGLKDGERIVSTGLLKARPGSKVSELPSAKSGETQSAQKEG